jgi:hypothetical protein
MDPTNDYRPVSPLAVAALVAGGCSAVALVTRFAWVVPLVGVALAVAALAEVGRPGVAKAGRLLALAGLALSLGFGGQAVTTTLVDRWILRHRAVTAAGLWLDAVREGRSAEALGLSAAAVLRSPGIPGEERPEGSDERLARFATLAPVQAVAACRGGRPRVTAAVPLGTDDGAWTVRASLADCEAAASAGTIRLVVVPKMVTSGTVRMERWMIVAIDLEPDRGG